MNTKFYNPFTKIAGTKALIYGIFILTITGILSFLSGTRLDGVIDIHFNSNSPWQYYILDELVAWLSTVIILYPVATILTRYQVRFIDILGTFAFARLPFLIAPFLGFFMKTNLFHEYLSWKYLNIGNEVAFQPFDMLVFIAIIILTLAITVWYIALLFNAYKVSTNLKSAKLIVSFILGVILAETLSKIILLSAIDHSNLLNT